MRKVSLTAIMGVVVIGLTSGSAWADGTETLGAPSIAIAAGTGVVIGGVGLAEAQPGSFSVDVPGDVVQVLLYWEGQSIDPFPTDDTIIVNGIPITGVLIGGPTDYGPAPWRTQTYRADITGLGLVGSGLNVLEVEGMDFNFANDGAGVVVIYDDGGTAAHIDLRDGNDFAFINFNPTLDATVPQVFTFVPIAEDRFADVSLMVMSVADDRGGPGGLRPTVVEVTVGGVVTAFDNVLFSNAGKFLDVLILEDISIPAGETSLTVQVHSRDDLGTGDLPASLTWLVGALQIPIPEALCRVTGGGADCDDYFSDGECSMATGRAKKHKEQYNAYTFGGQCGAPGSRFGEWTHSQKSGPSGKFTFHAGTHSAPADTILQVVECTDYPVCGHAAANGENKQIVCEGVGSFKNGIPPMGAAAGLHAVRIRIVDSGEPGRSGKQGPDSGCPADGFEGATADCGCPDYYHMTIHETSDPTSSVIYDVRGYIRSGNLQMHSTLD